MIDKKLTHLYAKKKRTKKPSPDRESSFGATKCKFELIGKDAQIAMYHLELVLAGNGLNLVRCMSGLINGKMVILKKNVVSPCYRYSSNLSYDWSIQE